MNLPRPRSPHTRSATRRPDQDGTALVEFVWLAVLLMVPLVWIVLSVFEVQRGAFSAGTAARAAGRAFVTAPDENAAWSRARAAAERALADQGLHVPVRVDVECSLGAGRCLAGTSVVTVHVRTSVPLPLVPSILGEAPAGVSLEATHSLPVGQYMEAAP